MAKYVIEVFRASVIKLEIEAADIEAAKAQALAGPNDYDAVIDIIQVDRHVTDAWVTGG